MKKRSTIRKSPPKKSRVNKSRSTIRKSPPKKSRVVRPRSTIRKSLPKKSRVNKSKRTPVSYKISKLVKEGIPHKQAVAIALSMMRSGKLGPRGGYKK